ncbi:helix-turn-helix domain-containing protein [Streptomyces sp. NPDC050147]|uniref:helix-turn-helix domain-containing protein n=1 Tax=Streptomyces sp. NPDC050147 TaxID=3155513 RepID=UPI0034291387
MTWLRDGRADAALTYGQLASRTEYSADTLARAASGRSVPQNLAVVLAYAAACGRSTKEAERLWKHARRDEARAQSVVSGRRSGVHISVVKDFADLHSALVDLHHDDGRPALRSLDARLGGVGRLPRSTVGRVLAGCSTPSRTFVAAFAEACNVRRSELPEWTKAWDRADADRRSGRLRSRTPGTVRRVTVHDDRVTPRDLQLLMSEMESTSRKTPALKLTIHVPDPASSEAEAAARMSRELLIDQAQRRGELACPQCRRPSFGYSDERGWASQLCSNCAPDAPHEGHLPASSCDAPRPELLGPTAGPSKVSAADTPTLVLRTPVPGVRPPLPRRKAVGSWPQPATRSPAPALDADQMPTLDEPVSPQPFIPYRGTPRAFRPRPTPAFPPATCELGSGCPEHGEGNSTTGQRQDHQPATVLATRIRINIPGFRPIPPVIVRTPGETAPGPHQPSAPTSTPADEEGWPGAQHSTHHPPGSVEPIPRGHLTDRTPPSS